MVRNWNKTINELLPYFKGLSNNVIINNDGHYSLPSYDTEENILTITELCETTLLLFSAYQSNSKKIKKILLLYLLIELNLNKCNLSNAERLLEDISFNANGEHPLTDVTIDDKYVENAFKDSSRKYDLKKYVL